MRNLERQRPFGSQGDDRFRHDVTRVSRQKRYLLGHRRQNDLRFHHSKQVAETDPWSRVEGNVGVLGRLRRTVRPALRAKRGRVGIILR